MSVMGLKPERVFYYFNEISKIPRGSGNEVAISNYLLETARLMNLEVIQDENYNIIIRKDGAPGYENRPRVILQGHMDMVCEKNKLTDHDFLKDGLKLKVIDDFVYATDTTLGADNGIAIAMALALLETDEHPPLEIIVTVDEEVNMTGAEMLNKKEITGDVLINLDSEWEGIFTAGCAGGGRITYRMPLVQRPNKKEFALKVAIRGLTGGHSGVDIHLEKGNAIKILGRILHEIRDDVDLAFIDGGSMDNAIPRESEAIVVTDRCKHVFEHLLKLNHILKNEFKTSDKGIELQVTTTDLPENVYTEKLKDQIIDAIILTPSGVLSRSTEIDLVITSNNLGVIKEKESIEIISAPRSSVTSKMMTFVEEVKRLGEILNIEVEAGGYYPGWTYDSDSKVCALARKIYEDMFDEKPEIKAIHAGLECGFFLEKKADLDAISFGPSLYEIHTPHEHVSISSVKRTYEFLLNLLKHIE